MTRRIFGALLMTVVAGVSSAMMQAEPGRSLVGEEHNSIVGSWMGTLDNGERLLMSFTSDGIALSSVQGGVSTTHPVFTLAHGVWARAGRREFAVTFVGINYDIQTGEYQGYGKVRALLTLDKTGDQMSAAAKVDIFAPDGSLIVTFLHTFHLTRIKVEPLD